MVLVTLGIFIISILVLVRASNTAIFRALRVSTLTGLSHTAIGFVFLAFGTSLPELSIAITSLLKGMPNISVANIIGANIFDIALVFGFTSLFISRVTKEKEELSYVLTLTSLIAFFAIILNSISVEFGIFSIILFLLFFYEVFHKKFVINNIEKKEPFLVTPELVKNIAILLGALLLVVISAQFVTDSAINLASQLGLTQAFVGLVLISIGTTLPEMAVSLTAVMKRKVSLAVGNVAGSLVVNLGFIFGILSIAHPQVLAPIESYSMKVFLLLNIIFMFLLVRGKFNKIEGISLIVFYWVFLLSLMTIF